jgi:hypothetical protein
MAREVGPESRTLETGVGVSTVLFAAWGCRHLAVAPFQHEADILLDYCAANGIDTRFLRFDVRTSQVALPTATGIGHLDLLLIDGCHGFPMPIIDWFYGAGMLQKGGVVVLDDINLPQVWTLIDTFLERDARWQKLAMTGKWAAFRRLSEGPLVELESDQPFFPDSRHSYWRRAKNAVPLSVRKAVRRAVPK